MGGDSSRETPHERRLLVRDSSREETPCEESLARSLLLRGGVSCEESPLARGVSHDDFWQSETFFTFYVRLLQRYFFASIEFLLNPLYTFYARVEVYHRKKSNVRKWPS